MLTPRKKTPGLELPLVGGDRFDLARDHGERGTLVVFYRGLHCPICAKQLAEMEGAVAKFAERGVKVVAVSADGRERAEGMAKKVEASALPIAYNLRLEDAREWGLFISTGRGKTSNGLDEPARFSEPGLFLVNPDGTLYFEAVQSMPFTRPHADELLAALDFAIANDYPARGEYTGSLAA